MTENIGFFLSGWAFFGKNPIQIWERKKTRYKITRYFFTKPDTFHKTRYFSQNPILPKPDTFSLVLIFDISLFDIFGVNLAFENQKLSLRRDYQKRKEMVIFLKNQRCSQKNIKNHY